MLEKENFMNIKSKGYWTKERCLEEARKYMNRNDFHKHSPSAYGKAWRKGWLDEICSHMKTVQHRSNYWTKEKCFEEAKKYHRRIDFRKNGRGAYNAAYVNGWLDEVCAHMDRPRNYSLEECRTIALKYAVERDWRINNNTSYRQAQENGWLPQLTGHMKKMHRYTKEECRKEAKKYMHKKDFMEKSPQYYFRACSKHWIQDICSHMVPLSNSQNRKIYAFEFEDNYAYIGLSYNPVTREKEHLREKDSIVYQHINETGSAYVFKILTDFLEKEEASRQEDNWIHKYQEEGWKMLNRKHGGDLGGKRRKYTKKLCAEIAHKYDYKVDFIKHDKKAYESARIHGFLAEICSHMKPKRPTPTKEEMKALVSKYQSLKEFRIENLNAYNYIRNHGWAKELLSHLEQRIYWTEEMVVAEAQKYNTLKEFRAKSPKAYDYARRHGIKWSDLKGR